MRFVRETWPVVVIVGTIAGAAWTAAWNVRDFLTTQSAASEARFTARIAASEARLAAQIAASETRLAAQIVASETRLAAQIKEVDERLTAQIAELRQYFVDHLEDHANPR